MRWTKSAQFSTVQPRVLIVGFETLGTRITLYFQRFFCTAAGRLFRLHKMHSPPIGTVHCAGACRAVCMHCAAIVQIVQREHGL